MTLAPDTGNQVVDGDRGHAPPLLPRVQLVLPIPIDKIDYEPGDLSEDNVASLKQSIAAVGLLHPITVAREGLRFRLVAGRHRLAAYQLLGRDRIEGVTIDEQHARLASIDENLARRELSPLARGILTAQRKAIHEELHPEARRGGAPGLPGGGKLKSTEKSFCSDLAQRTGRSETSIREDARIGHLPAEVIELVRGTPTEGNKGRLLELAKLKGEAQLDRARQWAHDATNPPKPVPPAVHVDQFLETRAEIPRFFERFQCAVENGDGSMEVDALQRSFAVTLVKRAAAELASVIRGLDAVGVSAESDPAIHRWFDVLTHAGTEMEQELVLVELCECGGDPDCDGCLGTGGYTASDLDAEVEDPEGRSSSAGEPEPEPLPAASEPYEMEHPAAPVPVRAPMAPPT